MRTLIVIIIFLSQSLSAYEYLNEYLEKNKSPEKQIIIDFIEKQFETIKERGVTQKQLDEVWQNKHARDLLHMARFQIVDNKLYAASSSIHRPYFLNLFNYFKSLVKKYKINDMDFIIYARDEIPENDIDPKIFKVPAFMMFKNYSSKEETNTLIMPDSTFLRKSWENLYSSIIKQREKFDWQNKETKFFWRGSATGGNYSIENIDQLARLKLVFLSKLYPNIIDAAIVNPVFEGSKKGKALKDALGILFGDAAKVDEIGHLNYKYLLSLDGNSATGTRVPWIMLSNSLLIKQESNKIEWFYPALKAYKHFVPISNDLTDIFKQYEWLNKNNDKLQIIIKNAQDFVENNLSPYDIDMQMLLILNKYSQIQKDNKIIATLTPEDDVISVSAVAGVILKKCKDYILNLFNF